MRSKFKWIFTLLIAFTMQFSFAQEKTVTGVVSDNSGPIPGANVFVKGTKKGTQTDFDGKFSIVAKQGDVLVFSFVGMEDTTATVGTSNTVSVKMQSGIKLTEVVVQGYREVSKKSAVTASATVNSKTIENRPNANVINTLQGQLAGVNITASSGQPGAKSTVVIRGVGTYNGNTDPLYVIDGFPSNSDNFRSINPNDIASVDVLKDAAALSEYGSRGSNGVIVIKTRHGKFGEAKTTFRYSTTYGVSDLQTPKYTYANARQLLRIERDYGSGLGANNPATGAAFTDAEINAYNVQTDWVKYFFRKGTSTSNNLSIENSSKNLNAFTSVSYFNQEGVLLTTGLQRFTVRNNINGKSNNEKFKYSINTSFGYSKNNEATNLGGGAINRNYVLGAYLSAPYISPAQYTGSQDVYDLYQADGTLLYTPLFLIDKLHTYSNLTEETRIDVSTEASYKLTNNFTARVRTGAQLLTTRFNQAEFPISFNAFLFAPADGIGGFEDINQRREFLFNNLWQLEYNKTIGKHTFNLTGSTEYNHSRLNTNNFRQRGLDPLTFVPNTGAGYVGDTSANDFHVPTISASQLRVDLISYFASFDYDYNKKYGFVASYRRDGASRFDKSKWGSFWSLGGRWNIEEEGFMKSLDAVKVLKLRASIGTVGNQRIVDGTIYAGVNPPAFADIYSNANNTYNGGQGYNISFGYPDLRWETTRQYNVGLDFELLKNSRIRGSIDYYNRKTIDLFIGQPVSPTSGTTSIQINSDADVTNKGVELNLAYDLIKNSNLTLTIRGNGSYNKNTIDGIKSNNGVILDGTQPTYITQNGGSLFEAYVYPYLGVNPVDGELLFEDINGNPTENPTAADRRATGKTAVPVYQGGFGFDLDYKGFFMSTSFTWAAQVWRFDADLQNLYDPDNIGTFNVTSDLANAWTPSNTSTNVPSNTAANRSATNDSDRFLKDASYIRLRNIQLGYKFPKRFIEKTFFTDVAVTLQGENLINFTKWQGFDPESDRTLDVYQYPTPKQITLGLDLKF
ncbi:SusC/RagA family TonB-linked outer membrane protein [Flavobacterium sp. N1994]|uniref:SusC/RagA family TonB-linked outer membrane protein n=1 Tax=Flavobacterium sp. N1994 TaxID=2986827 RepID=UPI002221D8D9|nr:SusC/RagA family TonB-linked outer membrane protein [Flavobacterium sp. N1994]